MGRSVVIAMPVVMNLPTLIRWQVEESKKNTMFRSSTVKNRPVTIVRRTIRGKDQRRKGMC